MSNGHGDRLARGGVKASFGAVQGTTADKWAEAFGNFDPLAYLKKTEEEELERQARRAQKLIDEEAQDERERQHNRDPHANSHGNASPDTREAVSSIGN